MPPLNSFFHGNFVLADLGTGNAAVVPWPEPLRDASKSAVVGGETAAALLSGIYPDALILATGPLTGTMTPGSGALFASCPGPDGKQAGIPLFPNHGPALKSAGVDFAVLTGTAPGPSVLVIAGRGAVIEPSGGIEKLDVSGMRKSLLARRPDFRQSLILCGPAGRNRSTWASAGLEAGTSLDRGTLAGWMAAHNLTAIVLAGNGPMPNADFGRSLFGISGPESGHKGFIEVIESAGLGEAAKTAAVKYLGRPAACRLCVRPCLAYMKPEKVGSGLLCTDHAGFAAMSESCPDSVPQALAICARLGLNPVSAASAIGGVPAADIEKALTDLPLNRTARPDAESVVKRPVLLLSHPGAEEKLAVGSILGICPLLMQRWAELPGDNWPTGMEEEEGTASIGKMLNASLTLTGLTPGRPRQTDTEL